MDDLHSRLALHRSNLNYAALQPLLNHFSSAADVLAASSTQLEAFDLGPAAIKRLKDPDHAGVERDLAWLQRPTHSIISIDHPAYPELLKNIPDPPYLLYAIGDLDYLQQPQLAMVGSRTPTASGRQTAEEFARHLSTAGLTISSGLARGIDSACHAGALQGIAGSVAVVANGLNKIYPASNTAQYRTGATHCPAGLHYQRSPTGHRAPPGAVSETQSYYQRAEHRHPGGGSRQKQRLADYRPPCHGTGARGFRHSRLHPQSAVQRMSPADTSGRQAGGNCRRYPRRTVTSGKTCLFKPY